MPPLPPLLLLSCNCRARNVRRRSHYDVTINGEEALIRSRIIHYFLSDSNVIFIGISLPVRFAIQTKRNATTHNTFPPSAECIFLFLSAEWKKRLIFVAARRLVVALFVLHIAISSPCCVAPLPRCSRAYSIRKSFSPDQRSIRLWARCILQPPRHSSIRSSVYLSGAIRRQERCSAPFVMLICSSAAGCHGDRNCILTGRVFSQRIAFWSPKSNANLRRFRPGQRTLPSSSASCNSQMNRKENEKSSPSALNPVCID